MPRIPPPAQINDAPAARHDLLESVKKHLGTVPNRVRLVSTSPAALQGRLCLSQAPAEGALPAARCKSIALAIARVNGCDYCLSAHLSRAQLGPAERRADGGQTAGAARWTPRRAWPTASPSRWQCNGGRSTAKMGRPAGRGLYPRPSRRNRGARGPEHLDRLRQSGGRNGDRLPARPCQSRLGRAGTTGHSPSTPPQPPDKRTSNGTRGQLHERRRLHPRR